MFKFESKVDKLIAVQCVLFAIGWLTYVDVVDKINEMTNGAFYRTAEQEWDHKTKLDTSLEGLFERTSEQRMLYRLLSEQRKYLVEELRR